MSDHHVCAAEEIPDGGHVLAELRGRQVAVFKLDGEYYAYTNWCPHQSGPVCEGRLDGTTEVIFDRETLSYEFNWVREGEILRCPWHAWEFDVTSGRCMHDEDIGLVSHPVRVENGTVVVEL